MCSMEKGRWIGGMESNVMTHTRDVDAASEQIITLFERYHQPLFAYLYRLLGEAEWAHDLTQDTFLRLYETRSRLATVENQRAWVYRIASNLAFNALKRRRRFQWLPWHDDGPLQREGSLAQGDPAATVETERHVSRALAKLSPEYRAPLLLFSQFDFSVREVATALEISEGAVKTRLFRAREMFREAYEQGEFANEERAK